MIPKKYKLKKSKNRYIPRSKIDIPKRGEVRRIAGTRPIKALINNPNVLFLDEPTASLDPEIGDFIRSFLENYKKEKKISILLASHNMSEVTRLCKTVLMMKDGVIIDKGYPEVLIKKHGRKNLEEVFLKLSRSSDELY